MLKNFLLTLVVTTFSINVFANNTIVEIKTTLGEIEIELFNDQAPISVLNFENYVRTNFYNDTIFHRVIPGFMVQGGGFTVDMQEKPVSKVIVNESYNGLQNIRGTLAMARTNDPHSAKTQFFINLEDNPSLDKGTRHAGYAVFAKVIKGMEVVDHIAKAPTTSIGSYSDVPKKPIKILDVQIKPNLIKKDKNYVK